MLDTGVKIDFIISGQYPGDGKPGPIAFPVPREASIEQRRHARRYRFDKWIELKLASGQAAARRRDWAMFNNRHSNFASRREFGDQLDRVLREVYFSYGTKRKQHQARNTNYQFRGKQSLLYQSRNFSKTTCPTT